MNGLGGNNRSVKENHNSPTNQSSKLQTNLFPQLLSDDSIHAFPNVNNPPINNQKHSFAVVRPVNTNPRPSVTFNATDSRSSTPNRLNSNTSSRSTSPLIMKRPFSSSTPSQASRGNNQLNYYNSKGIDLQTIHLHPHQLFEVHVGQTTTTNKKPNLSVQVGNSKNNSEQQSITPRTNPSDYFYYHNNAQIFWNEVVLNRELQSSPSKDKDISNGVTDLIPGKDDALKKELSQLHKQSRAMTLWNLSEGLSSVTNKNNSQLSGGNLYVFGNDYFIFNKNNNKTKEKETNELRQTQSRLKSNRSNLNSNLGSTRNSVEENLYFVQTMKNKNSRPSSASSYKNNNNITDNNPTGTFNNDNTLTSSRIGSLTSPQHIRYSTANLFSEKRPFEDLIDSVGSSGKYYQSTIFNNSDKMSVNSQQSDSTWRTYMTSETGRTVSSIYHPNTRRPSRIKHFIEKSVVTNESLYKYISTENVRHLNLERCIYIDNKILKSIGEYCSKLETLNLQHCTQLKDSTIRVIVNGCPDIKSLNIGMCHLITDESIFEIFLHCKKLQVLSLHSCDLVTGETSFANVKYCKTLQILDISYCSKFTDLGLEFISEYCTSLKHLDISGCSKITDDGIIAVCQHCTQLKTLRAMIMSTTLISNNTLSIFTKCAANLVVLEIPGMIQLTDESVIEICKYGINLEYLSLSGCFLITDRSIQAIQENCKQMKCVEIASCKKVGVQSLLELIHGVQKLKRLVITGCNISMEEEEILKNLTNGRVEIVKQKTRKIETPKEYFTIVQEKEKKIKKTKKTKKKTGK
ncbi:hypothetical protein ABK040_011147 [Willaertia magna]